MKNRRGYIPLDLALLNHAPDALVRTLIAFNPTALTDVARGKTPRWDHKARRGTVLHMLAVATCSSAAERRCTNTVCFTLVELGAPLVETDTNGHTPAECAAGGIPPPSHMRDREPEYNHHLIATFHEIALYKQRRHAHLSVIPHFRDWSTVTHAWCTPSAKLTALTVLLAGETYKRGLLPRLPMDCWYRVLGMIPRHELRQGNCEPAAEQAAQAHSAWWQNDVGLCSREHSPQLFSPSKQQVPREPREQSPLE